MRTLMGKDARYRARLTRDEMERRRLAAARDLEEGLQQSKVARKYGVSRATVSRWAKTLRHEGVKGLRATKASGKSRLTERQLETLLEILLDGARASGFDTDIWTTDRVRSVIQREFKVTYDTAHLSRLLRQKLQLSYQKPKRVANERDELARATWLRTTWPRSKKDSLKARRSFS